MIFNFEISLRESLGTIYYNPILDVRGSFDPEKELEEFIEQITKDIRDRTKQRLEKK